MVSRLTYFYVLFYLITISSQANAQAIIINPNSLPTAVMKEVISYETLFVNGIYTHGLTENIAKNHMYLGTYYKTLLSFIALRMVAKDEIKLHESISFTLPDTLERNPFRVAVTPHHILTETAGFAVPVRISDTPLERYTSHVRTAGQMAHNDIIGWALLIEFLEAKSGQTIEKIIEQEILNPLGLNLNSLAIPDTISPLQKLEKITGNGLFFTEITRLLIRNRTPDGKRFLPPTLYNSMTAQQSWRMHPLTPNHTYAGVFAWSKTQRWLEPAPSNLKGPAFMAFPEAGIAFINLKGLNTEFRAAVKSLAQDRFLPMKSDNRLGDASLLTPYERFSGYYVRADAPTAWLKDRLQTINNSQLYIREENNGILSVKPTGKEQPASYEHLAPFHYTNHTGTTVTLSPYKSGGYLMLDGVLYRYAGILGNKTFVISLFPFVIILLLSTGFYANSKTSRAWRRMGQFGFIGTLLICTGLLCDYLWWPIALFEWDLPVLIYAWRILLNIGLVLVLSLPLFALSFVRHNRMPEGSALMYVPFHLALISIAAVALFLILIAWGMAAEFSAY